MSTEEEKTEIFIRKSIGLIAGLLFFLKTNIIRLICLRIFFPKQTQKLTI